MVKAGPMSPQLKRAVDAALAAQGGMIYPGKELPIERFMEMAKPETPDPKPNRSYQSIYAEKNRAGFRHLNVADYCKMLSLLEQDEIVT